MYVVSTTFHNQAGDKTDDYEMFDTLQEAQAKYNELIEMESTYTAQISLCIESTDPQHCEGNVEYFLFGEEASRIYEDDGIDELIRAIEEDLVCYQIEDFRPGIDTAGALTAEMDGWLGYAILDDEDYKKLQNL